MADSAPKSKNPLSPYYPLEPLTIPRSGPACL